MKKKSFHTSGDDVVTLTSEDYTGRKILKIRCNANDAKSVSRVFNRLIEKYNLSIFVKYYGDLSKDSTSKFLDSMINFKW